MFKKRKDNFQIKMKTFFCKLCLKYYFVVMNAVLRIDGILPEYEYPDPE